MIKLDNNIYFVLFVLNKRAMKLLISRNLLCLFGFHQYQYNNNNSHLPRDFYNEILMAVSGRMFIQ